MRFHKAILIGLLLIDLVAVLYLPIMSAVLKRRKISHEANGDAVILARTQQLEKKNERSEHKHGGKVRPKGGQLGREKQETQEVQGKLKEQEIQEKQGGGKQEGEEQERQDQGKDSNDEGTESVSQSRVKHAQDKIVSRRPSVPEPQAPQKSFADLVTFVTLSLPILCTNLSSTLGHYVLLNRSLHKPKLQIPNSYSS